MINENTLILYMNSNIQRARCVKAHSNQGGIRFQKDSLPQLLNPKKTSLLDVVQSHIRCCGRSLKQDPPSKIFMAREIHSTMKIYQEDPLTFIPPYANAVLGMTQASTEVTSFLHLRKRHLGPHTGALKINYSY